MSPGLQIRLALWPYCPGQLVKVGRDDKGAGMGPVSYTHLRAHETEADLVCRLLLEKKKKTTAISIS